MEKQIKENLEILPEKIYKKEKEILGQQQELNELDLMIKSTEVATYNLVSSENKEGKKTFSNENMRKAETERRLEGNVNYIEQKKKRDELYKNIKIGEIELSFIKRTFRACEALTRGE